MKLQSRTIQAISKVITGDLVGDGHPAIAPYRSGPKLVAFFRNFGGDDTYGQGFPSRWKYTEDKLFQYNDTSTLVAVVEAAFSVAHFLDTDFDIASAASHVNKFLELDDYSVGKVAQRFRIRTLSWSSVKFKNPVSEEGKLSHIFINEQTE